MEKKAKIHFLKLIKEKKSEDQNRTISLVIA